MNDPIALHFFLFETMDRRAISTIEFGISDIGGILPFFFEFLLR